MFPMFIFVVALLIAGNAAYFSVKGIGLLFAGSFMSVIIMASSLEIGKLTAVSFIYRKWYDMKWLMKLYLSISILILMLITSIGIYGFLSDAYQNTKTKVDMYRSQIESIESINVQTRSRIDNILIAGKMVDDKTSGSLDQYQQIYDNYISRTNVQVQRHQQRVSKLDEDVALVQSQSGGLFSSKKQKLKAINELQVQEREYIKSELDSIDDQNDIEYNNFMNKVDELSNRPVKADDSNSTAMMYDDIRVNEEKIVELKRGISDTDIGSFKFIAESLNVETDVAVKWFILSIVLVFDPLAVCLMLGYNMFVMRTPYEGYVNESPIKKKTSSQSSNVSSIKGIIPNIIHKAKDMVVKPPKDVLTGPAMEPRRRQNSK